MFREEKKGEFDTLFSTYNDVVENDGPPVIVIMRPGDAQELAVALTTVVANGQVVDPVDLGECDICNIDIDRKDMMVIHTHPQTFCSTCIAAFTSKCPMCREAFDASTLRPVLL